MLVRRAFALWIGLWFALLTGESGWLSGCPAHSSGAHGTTVAVELGQDDAVHAHHAPVPAGEDIAHQCGCPGPGCTSATALPGGIAASPLSSVIEVAADIASTARQHEARSVEHVLPFANAPPTAALSA